MGHGNNEADQGQGKKPPERPHIALAEALTWIAFGDAMGAKKLRAQVEGHRPAKIDSAENRLRKSLCGIDDGVPEVPGFGHFEDRERGLERLNDAWRDLRDRVERGTIKVRGRFTSTYSPADARLAKVVNLTGDILTTFSQFDVSTGGIRRQPIGSPDVLWRNHQQSYDREIEALGDEKRTADGYLEVEVQRVGLLGKGSAARKARAPSVKAGRAPTDEDILAKADEMKARRMDGRTLAGEMRHELGFENVATTQVRELIKGRWKPLGRPKRESA